MGRISSSPVRTDPGSFLKNIRVEENSIPIQKNVHLAHRPGAHENERLGSLWHVSARRGLIKGGLTKAPKTKMAPIVMSRPEPAFLRLTISPGASVPVEMVLYRGFSHDLKSCVLSHFNRMVHVVVAEQPLPATGYTS